MPTILPRTAALCAAALLAVPSAQAQHATQTLLATPTTVAWGYYSARAKPVLTESAGKYNSAPPWMHGGNMDNKELVAGTTVYYPVNAKGALFEAGDGHANQGNGEVDITALETQLTGTFQFIVHKAQPAGNTQRLIWPSAETPSHYIAMGFDEDLKIATQIAIRNMITFLSEQNPHIPHITPDDAYALLSVACDVNITQLVDTKSGVHVMCPKNLFATPQASH